MKPHITPTRLVELRYDAAPTAEDIAALVETVSAYWALTANMAHLEERGAVIVLASGDEVELSPEAIDDHLTNEGERAQEANDQAYYGGDSPGSYGPSDPRGAP